MSKIAINFMIRSLRGLKNKHKIFEKFIKLLQVLFVKIIPIIKNETLNTDIN